MELVHLAMPNTTFLNQLGGFKFREHSCCVYFKTVTKKPENSKLEVYKPHRIFPLTTADTP